MSKPYYLNYLTEYSSDTPQFRTALKEATAETLQAAAKRCTKTNLKRIEAELRRRGRSAYKPIYEKIQNDIYTKFPITQIDNPVWQEGARNYICGIMMLSCADNLDKMSGDFNLDCHILLDNVRKLISDKDNIKTFIAKKRRRDLEELPKKLIQQVNLTCGKTFNAYFEEVERYLK